MSIAPDNLTAGIPKSVAVPLVQSEEFAPREKRWNREEYYRLAELGLIRDKHVELIGGVIYEVSPHSFEHYWSVDAIADLLKDVFGHGFWVRQQGPCVHGDRSEPEPDITVVKGERRSFSAHPTTAVLTIEVSKSSLFFDRGRKASLYAAMEIPDYWVLDIENRTLWVHRDPVTDSGSQFGCRYSQVESVAADGSVAPLAMPNACIAVAQMLPPETKA